MPKRANRDDVDRLGSWYQESKIQKVTPVDLVTKIMAPRSSVTGSEARDIVMADALRKAPKVGNRIFKGGRAYRPKMQSARGVKYPQIPSASGAGFWDDLSKGTKIFGAIHPTAGVAVNGLMKLVGHGGGRILRKLPGQTLINNDRGNGMVYPIPDLKTDAELAKTIAMTKHGSPLDENNDMALSNLPVHKYNLVKNFKHKRLLGLNPRRKITKGGKTFVSFKNLLVTPNAAP